MKYPLEEELLLKRFLLGELSQNEQSDIEERLFADPQYFSQFRAAEDELIDEYLYGDLDGSERERFEKYFVTTPERRESLRVAKALQQYIVKKGPSAATVLAGEPPAPRSWLRTILDILGLGGNTLRFATVAMVLLIVAIGVWLVVRTGQNQPGPSLSAESANVQPSPAQIAQANDNQNNQNTSVQSPQGNRNGNAGRDINANSRPEQPRARYSFVILPLAQVRGEGGVNEVKLPADAGFVNLKVPLVDEGSYDHYQVKLQTASDKTVKSWSNIKPASDASGQTISVDIPAISLREQKYRLALSGVTSSGDLRTIRTYHFQVKK